MLFNSVKFLYAFLPIAYLVFWLLRTKEQRYIWLTITGYVFYAFWNYKFCSLMLFSTVVSFLAGLGLARSDDPRARRWFLVVPIAVDLALLGYFKYANFGMETVATLLHRAGIPVHLPTLMVVLPVGISFYTFHTITYIVDSYRRVIRPTRNFFEFACYVALFPQLVAGPIVRFRQVEADLENIDHSSRLAYYNMGWSFLALGMVKKVLIADTLAAMIDPLFGTYQYLGTTASWMVMLGYSYQLYFDFSGYSDMAVGLGYLFGIRLPQNFNSPYKAIDISDFWRRWHISLSTCLRDYLYIPLGGNRGSAAFVFRNLMITMLLGGLWHGANWTFVIWGAYHGILLYLNRLLAPVLDRAPNILRRAGTFILVLIGWVMFRSTSVSMAQSMLATMFRWTDSAAIPWALSLTAVLLASAVIAHTMPNTFELRHEWRPFETLAITALFGVCLFVIQGGQASPFLYFQF
jgi:alginate O-acetyltransferase complex protein AlgI